MIQHAQTLEHLTDEFLAEVRSGSEPRVSDYVVRYPQWSDEIRELFPAALAMERLKNRRRFGRTGSQGGVMLGGRCVKHLGDYRLVRELGRGGMGVVYEAVQESLDRVVAVKVLNHSALIDENQAKRFEREAQSAARLHHTNIVPVFGFGEQDGVYYYVMPLIAGVSLDKVIQWMSQSPHDDKLSPEHWVAWDLSDRPRAFTHASTAERRFNESTVTPEKTHDSEQAIPPDSDDSNTPQQQLTGARPQSSQPGPGERTYWRQVARIGTQVADALDHAHQQGTLHRDVKPANLIVDQLGSVWIMDFGLAKTADCEKITHSGDAVGTLRYMAPEQFDGQCDARSDLYSLGMTLYEMATLQPAYSEQGRAQLVERILRHDPPPPKKLNPQIPRDLETIILKAISREPDDRYASAQALSEDLNRFLEDRPILARRVSPWERLYRWCRRNPAVAIPVTIAIMLLGAVASVASLGYVNVNAALAGKAEQQKIANQNLVIANQHRRQAERNLNRVEQERSRAHTNLDLSLNALETVFQRFAPADLYCSVERTSEGESLECRLDTIVTEEDIALLNSLLSFYDEFAELNRDEPRLQRDAANAYRRVGDIHQRLGQFVESEKAYRRAMAIYDAQLEEQPLEQEYWVAKAAIKNELGMVSKMAGQPADAQCYHLDARQILKDQLHRDPDSLSANLELVRTHNLLGCAIWGHGRNRRQREPSVITAAEDSHRDAVRTLETLIAQDVMNPEYRLMMARSYRDLSPVLFCRNKRDEAIEINNRAIKILEELVEMYPSVPTYKYELMRIYSSWDRRVWGEQGWSEGERRYRQALRLAGELTASHPAVSEYSARVAYTHFKLGRVLTHQGKVDQSLEQYRQSIELQSAQIEKYPTVPIYQLYLAMAQSAMAEVMYEQGEFEEARTLLENAIQSGNILEQRLRLRNNRHYARKLLVDQYTYLSKTLTELNELDLAVDAKRNADLLLKP